MGKSEDLTGQRFGKLVVVDRADDYIQPSGRRRIQWNCVCDCGGVKVIKSDDLKSGHTTSCGCYRKNKMKNKMTKSVIIGVDDLKTYCLINNLQYILDEWDDKANENKPEQVRFSALVYQHWICPLGHHYSSRIYDRVKLNYGCPYCSSHKLLVGYNDLLTKSPDLAKEWHPSKNGDLKPIDITFRSSTKVWWLCKYGHSFQASPDTRYSGISCPYCSNKKVLPGWNDFLSYCNTYNLQYLLDEWDYESNNIYPYDILPKTEKKICWKCNFGHTWVTSPKNRILKKSMCPICQKSKSTSFAEQCLYFYLSKCYSNVVNGSICVLGSKTLDVYVPEINTGFEFDGARWHTDILLDIEKNELCAKNGVHLYRIREKGCPELPYNEFVTVLSCESSKNKKAIESCLKLLFAQLDLTCDINVMRDELSIRSLYVAGKKSKSIANMYPNVAIDFDYVKNKNLTPDVVNYASNMRLWWKCHVCGHEWNSIVESRTIHNRGCPKCGRLKISRKVLCVELQKEFNSLQDAADFCNLKGTGGLSLACQGKIKTSGGYHWKYVDK